jgi:hypothetical protein
LNALTPVPAFFFTRYFPRLREVAALVNPATQIICYVPLVTTMIGAGTSRGVSLFGQHLNFCGGLWGFAMCALAFNCRVIDWCFYGISVLQAMAVFGTAIYFGEFRVLDQVAQVGQEREGNTADILTIGEEEEESGMEKTVQGV